MSPSQVLVSVLLPVAISCLLLAMYTWRNREEPGAEAFVVVMLAGAGLCAANLGEAFAATFPGKMIWNNLSYLPLTLIPTAFFLLAMSYTGRERYLTKRNIALLCIMPCFTILMVWTNDLHHWYYSWIGLTTTDDLTYPIREYGILSWAWMYYAYLLLLIGSMLLVGLYFGTPKRKRGQIGLVTLGGLVGWSGNYVYLNLNPFPFLDTTSVAVFTAGMLVFLGIYRYRLFDITPIARMVTFDRMKHGVIVTDRKGRVVDANGAALTLMRSDASEVIDSPLTEAFARRPELLEAIAMNHAVSEVDLRWGDCPLIVEMHVHPVYEFNGARGGSIIVLEDVTEQRHAEYELRLTQEKLDMLNSITAHDIMNRVMVIRGYVTLLEGFISDAKGKEHLSKIAHATESIQRLVRFSKDYQAGKVSAMAWRSPYTMLYQVSAQLETSLIELDPSLHRVELYADALLEKVFYNIIENSLRHGGKVTKIRAWAQQNDGHLSLIIQDDGIGIPLQDKEKIFQQGYGRNNGYGLFFSRELASVMGFSIEENGVPGEGARFEIRVPQNKFRWKGAVMMEDSAP
ncbi:MAG: histidine kinase N-terminal 7TM domain-containing protein [Methanomassiliicoccales archaeon]